MREFACIISPNLKGTCLRDPENLTSMLLNLCPPIYIYIYELKVKVMCFSSISDFGCLKESVAHETLQSKPQTYTGGHSCGSYYPGFDV